MNDLLKYSHLFTSSLLLCTVPSFALPPTPESTISQEYVGPSPFIQRLFTEDRVLSYDAIVELLEQIENDELDALCTPEDWNQIGEFLAYLSRQGMLPKDCEIDKAMLERDIQDMLCPEPELAVGSYFLGTNEFFFAPAIYNGNMDPMLCKGWIGKKWKHVKHFVKHHKMAVIIGTIIVVAAVAVVVTVAIASSAAAAAGAAAAAAGSSDPKTQQQEAETTTVEEQVSTIKTIASDGDLVPLNNEDVQIDADQARLIGSTLAHVAIETSPPISQDAWDKIIQSGHGLIDSAFSTDQAIHYIDNENPGDWHINLYQQQGELALRQADYEQAVEHFGKAIEANPQNPDIYLQRAYAHMGLDEFDQSLNDYCMYVTCEASQPKPSVLSNTIDFGIGFAKNLPKGAIESGRQLTAFASDLIVHPIDTSCNVCNAFSTLAQLVCSQEWETLSQSVAPEVCQLVEEWNTLSSQEQGERAGYVFGKYGGDILIPGATAKVLSKGINGAKDVVLAAKNLQTAEQTLALDALAQSASRAGVLENFPVQFKKMEGIEGGIKELPVSEERILQEQDFWNFHQKYKNAEAFLKPYQGAYLPENQVRDLIHQTGIPTFPRPQGIPENYLVKLSNSGAGIKYVHPNNENTYVRIMPGKPHSSNPCQQKPYVTQVKNGQYLDKSGNVVDGKSPEAHIPVDEFICRNL